MQEHKKDAETSKEYTSNETDPNKRTIRLIVSAIKIENTWDKCHQADCDKDQTGDEFIHSSGLYADFLRYLLQYVYGISPIVNTVRSVSLNLLGGHSSRWKSSSASCCVVSTGMAVDTTAEPAPKCLRCCPYSCPDAI